MAVHRRSAGTGSARPPWTPQRGGSLPGTAQPRQGDPSRQRAVQRRSSGARCLLAPPWDAQRGGSVPRSAQLRQGEPSLQRAVHRRLMGAPPVGRGARNGVPSSRCPAPLTRKKGAAGEPRWLRSETLSRGPTAHVGWHPFVSLSCAAVSTMGRRLTDCAKGAKVGTVDYVTGNAKGGQ